jgi:hypothetical protein
MSPPDVTAPLAVATAKGRGDETTTREPNPSLPKPQEEVIEQAPRKYRNLLRQAFQGATSPRRAIQACCLTCTHYNTAEIAACTVLRCPLHAYRPYRVSAE